MVMELGRLGIVFDWDGVIIDSHDQHEKSWFRLAEEFGKAITHAQFTASFGMRNADVLTTLLRWVEPGDEARVRAWGDRKEVLYREILEEDGLEPLPGVRRLLSLLRESGVPFGVGTSTSRENVETAIRLTGLGAEWFAGICAADDVSQGKPAPDVFLETARRIGRAPRDCVVFEDAPVGIEAGKRAGMKVVAVTTTRPAAALTRADQIVASLEEISLEGLLAL